MSYAVLCAVPYDEVRAMLDTVSNIMSNTMPGTDSYKGALRMRIGCTSVLDTTNIKALTLEGSEWCRVWPHVDYQMHGRTNVSIAQFHAARSTIAPDNLLRFNSLYVRAIARMMVCEGCKVTI